MAAGRFRRRRELQPDGPGPARRSSLGFSIWALVTLSLAAVAVIALAATALFIGQDAVIAIAVVCVVVFPRDRLAARVASGSEWQSVNPCCLPAATGRNAPRVTSRNSGIGNDGAAR
jgi:hypothetical protein